MGLSLAIRAISHSEGEWGKEEDGEEGVSEGNGIWGKWRKGERETKRMG